MSAGQQTPSHPSPSLILLLGVVFSWVVMGMIYVSSMVVREEAANRVGFNFDLGFYLMYAATISVSAYGAHVAAQAWVMGVGRFNLDFTTYAVASVSFAVLAGIALTHIGLFPLVINVPIFLGLAVVILIFHWNTERGQQAAR